MRIYPSGTRIKHKNNVGEIVLFNYNLKKYEIKWIKFNETTVQGWVGWLKDSDIQLETPIQTPKIEIKSKLELTLRRKS